MLAEVAEAELPDLPHDPEDRAQAAEAAEENEMRVAHMARTPQRAAAVAVAHIAEEDLKTGTEELCRRPSNPQPQLRELNFAKRYPVKGHHIAAALIQKYELA